MTKATHTFYRWTSWNGITKVEVERFTDSSVWIGGRRSDRKSKGERWLYSENELKQFLLERKEHELQSSKTCVSGLSDSIDKLKAVIPIIETEIKDMKKR